MSARACEHCGTENDDTRVFCANCGTRLPELASVPDPSRGVSAAAAVRSSGATAPPLPGAPVRRKATSLRTWSPPQRGLFTSLLSGLLSTAAVGALFACLIQMAREPDNLPPVVGVDTAAAEETFSTLRELASSSKPVSWTINRSAINQFLETTVVAKPEGAAPSNLTAAFQRAFVRLKAGGVALGIDQLFLGRNFYFLLDLQPESSNGGLGAKPIGGSIGRMPIPPALMPVFIRLFEPTIGALSQPLELIKRAGSVTITPDDAALQWPGTAKTAP